MRISKRGPVTIPAQLRELLGLLPGTEVELGRVGNSVRVRKARSRNAEGKRSSTTCARIRRLA